MNHSPTPAQLALAVDIERVSTDLSAVMLKCAEQGMEQHWLSLGINQIKKGLMVLGMGLQGLDPWPKASGQMVELTTPQAADAEVQP